MLEIVLEAGEGSFLVPAHIWTPWFSVLGSKSGFDTIAECYGDLAEHVFAVETGLSSDPEMNGMCTMLDRYTLISNSDAHSPEKIGREANRFDCAMSFPAMRAALMPGGKGFGGTIEFFPQEGKYHYDGHRKCGVCLDPLATARAGSRCPVCGKPLTVGVMYRVAELADREAAACPVHRPFDSVTGLVSIVAEVLDAGPNTKKVRAVYHDLLAAAGPEFTVLLEAPLDRIAVSAGAAVAEGVRRMRAREAFVEDGYDGEFGRVRFFQAGEPAQFAHSTSLCNMQAAAARAGGPRPHGSVAFSIAEFKQVLAAGGGPVGSRKPPPDGEYLTLFG